MVPQPAAFSSAALAAAAADSAFVAAAAAACLSAALPDASAFALASDAEVSAAAFSLSALAAAALSAAACSASASRAPSFTHLQSPASARSRRGEEDDRRPEARPDSRPMALTANDTSAGAARAAGFIATLPPHSHAKPGPQDGVHDVAALATREAEVARRSARARQRLGTGAIRRGRSVAGRCVAVAAGSVRLSPRPTH